MVNRVADQKNIFQLSKSSKTIDLVPRADFVIRDKKNTKALTAPKSFQLFDVVVRNPELLQSGANLIKTLNVLNIVSSERQNLQITKISDVHNLLDLVG